jgi:CheY-like chemotaxis protein
LFIAIAFRLNAWVQHFSPDVAGIRSTLPTTIVQPVEVDRFSFHPVMRMGNTPPILKAISLTLMSNFNPNRCILLIDDEPDLCRIVKVTLERLKDWTILTAHTGQDGFTIAQTQPLDLILLDLSLPDGNGLAWLQTLKTNSATQSIPVILFTASDPTSTDALEGDSTDITGVILKPFSVLQLADQIITQLHW